MYFLSQKKIFCQSKQKSLLFPTCLNMVSFKIPIFIILCLFLFSVNGLANSNTKISSNYNAIDLSDWNIDKKTTISLHGPWLFYWKKLLKPTDFEKELPSSQKKIYLPQTWSDKNSKETELNHGFATYAAKVILPKKKMQIALKISNILTAYKLWIDGELRAHGGKLATNINDHIPRQSKRKLIPISATKNEITIVLQVSNFTLKKGGIKEVFELGKMEYFQNKKEHDLIAGGLFVGSITALGLLLGLTYIISPSISPLLYLSAICIFIAIRYLLYGDGCLLNNYLIKLNWHLHSKLEVITLYLTLLLIIRFFNVFFPKEFNLFNRVSTISLAILMGVIIISPINHIIFYTDHFFGYIAILISIVTFALLVRTAILKRKNAMMILLTNILIIGMCFNDFLTYLNIVDLPSLRNYAIVLFIIAHTLILARHFAISLRNAEKIQTENRLLITDLEKTVTARTETLLSETRKLAKANRELEENNKIITTSYQKLKDIDVNKKQILEQIEDIENNHLYRLDHFIIKMKEEKNFTPDTLDAAAEEVLQIKKAINPISSLYASERHISSRLVLVAEEDKKEHSLIKLSLGGTGVNLKIVSTETEGKILVDQINFDVIFLSTKFLRLARYTHLKSPETKLVFMTSDTTANYLSKLKENEFITNIIHRDIQDPNAMSKAIVTTASKILSNDLFGLEKYLNWGVDVWERRITGSLDRASSVADIRSYLQKLGLKKSIIDRTLLVAEELVMNAIYDAPKTKDGKDKYNHLPRTIAVNLKPEEQALLRLGFDGVHLAISIEDPFGSLSMKIILHYLEKCIKGDIHSIHGSDSKSGGGLGLFQIMSASDQVIINVKKKVRTEFISILKVGTKKRSRMSTSFHYFME